MTVKPRKPWWRRCLKAAVYLMLVSLVGITSLVLYRFRDRSPDYHLDLLIKADPPPTNHLFRVGFGRSTITPDLQNAEAPVYLAGFGQGRVATGNYDGLWAVACVLDDGRTRVALVGLDAIGFFHDDVVAVRRLLRSSLEIDYLLIASTHNHEVPDLMGLWGPKPWKSGVSESYLRLVKLSIVQAVQKAVRALQPATMELHEVPAPSAGLVNDTRLPVVYDPDIRMMLFRRSGGGARVLGSIVTWANHPETLWSENTQVTADYVGHFRKALEQGVTVKGDEVMPGLGGTHLYLNGAIGGLMTPNPSLKVRDPFLEQEFEKPSHEKARALGRQLAWRVAQHLRGTNAGTSQPVIALKARTIELPMTNPMFYLACGLGVINRGQSSVGKLRSEVALLELGEASLAAIPGEIYPELVNGGIETPEGADYPGPAVEVPPIRDLMPGRVKFVLGLANDEVGYIIPKTEWDDKAPWLYGSPKRHYGEINSLGPDTAQVIHQAFVEMTGYKAGAGK